MERYKLFVNEIKEENEKIVKKIIYVNNRIKYKESNDNKISYNNYFIKSYEDEKKDNVYKYFKYKIIFSKKKKRYLNDTFPYFDIYKNTNDAFRNNLNGYKIFEILKSYDELEIFNFCSKNKLKNISYIYHHFIQVIINKRDLYNIHNLLLLTENIRKLNFYHPYFCKVICREVCLDIYKIKKLEQITSFINFLMHFNIFNFYYLNKIYKYVIYLITTTNKWDELMDTHINNNVYYNIDMIIQNEQQNTSNIKQNNLQYDQHNQNEYELLPIYPNDISILLKSFLKYKYFHISLLKLLMYICINKNYPQLRDSSHTLFMLSSLSNYYYFINKNYYSNVFFKLFKNVINEKRTKHNDFVLILKGFYNICKTFSSNNISITQLYNTILKNYNLSNEFNHNIKEHNNVIHEYGSSLILYNSKREKKNKNKIKHKNVNVNENDVNCINSNNNMNNINNMNNMNNIHNNNVHIMETQNVITLQPFNNHIQNSNLKKLNINNPNLIIYSVNHTKKQCFNNLFDTIKYIILFIELKIIEQFPLKKYMNIAEIEFLKRRNFERDKEKNVYKYISQNISEEQNQFMQSLLTRNKKENSQFDDSNMNFLFYMNYLNKRDFKNFQNECEPTNEPTDKIIEKHIQDDQQKKNENTINQGTHIHCEKKTTNITSEDINNYLKNKSSVKFNLSDSTYFSHIYFNLSSMQLTKEEENILNNSFKELLKFKDCLQELDVNDAADLFYSLTIFQILQGYPKGTITKNKFGYSKVQQNEENEKIYKILSNIIIKKSINIKEENIYKVILSCANSAYSDVYLNYYLKNFNRYIKFSKMRKFINC
ncbi:conserved Plasmodium protein, unknown function [Plasmodium reichenowi]|uniref:Uncharacterized protein n=1 Tax=Plasmodium reichenowi TaxID=5854 RepID=A0A2P9D8Q5_PLARE|nr:conserved Plasmodium protein, unknown function [Plasmodium reichenowi]